MSDVLAIGHFVQVIGRTHTHPGLSALPRVVANTFVTGHSRRFVAVAEMSNELQRWTECRSKTLQSVSVNAAECYNLTEL